MKKLSSLACLLLVWAFGGLGLSGFAATVYQTGAVITCRNNPYQGEALLVTVMGKPMQFTCQPDPLPDLPSHYKQVSATYTWKVSSGDVRPNKDEADWTPKECGLQTITVEAVLTYASTQNKGFFSKKEEDIVIQAEGSLPCVVPYQIDSIADGKVRGFEVGIYPDPTNPNDLKGISHPNRIREHLDTYSPPKLFYEVTPQTYHLKVFGDYALGEFDLDPRFSSLTYPRYIALNPKILDKLALLQQMVQRAGVPLTKFNLIYGFRSPAYNLGSAEVDGDKSLKSSFSIHMYGLALDIIVDENHDYILDDLNGDGRTTIADANALRQYVDQLDKELREKGSPLVGAAFTYVHHDYWERGNFVQTPYVHFDARGHTREDGTLIRGQYEDTIGITKLKEPYTILKPIPNYPF